MAIIYPENTNFLSPLGFELYIEKLDLTYYTQRVSLPGMSLGAPEEGSTLRNVPMPGETISYDPFTVDFLIDEHMKNYQAIYNWFIGIAYPESHEQYRDFIRREYENQIDPTDVQNIELALMYSQGRLVIMNARNNPTVTINIYDMTPIYLSSPEFNVTLNDVNYVTASASFKIDRYDFVVSENG